MDRLLVGQTKGHDDDEPSDLLQRSASSVTGLRRIRCMWLRIASVLILLAVVGPLTVVAQGLPKVGYLSIGSASDPRRAALLAAFQRGLRDLGYIEGKNILIEVRFAEGPNERLPDLAAELTHLKVDVIVTYSTQATQAAQNATNVIPIVMSGVSDPQRTGLVTALGRPGGNVTGLSMMAPELVVKQMQFLKELAPKVSRVALLWNPASASNVPSLREAEKAAPALGVRLQSLEVRGPDDLDRAFAAMRRERAGGVIVLGDALFIDNRKRIASLAEQTRVPDVYGIREHAEAGGLVSYGANLADMNRRAAGFVDKILKGAKAADLPIEQAIAFELIINLKTARTRGLAIPQSLLLRADQVIE